MQRNKTLLLTVIFMVFAWGNVAGQVRINEIRANDDGSDESEFVELIGIAGTEITGYTIYHVNGDDDSEIFTHTIGEFTIPDDGITDENSNTIGFYVLGASGFLTGTDESTSSALQNGPDGVILYDNEGNVVDAVAWGGAGLISSDIIKTGSPEADHYLHITENDGNDDNSLQAPDNVVGDDGSGWGYNTATIGTINFNQTDGNIVLISSIKPEPANHVTSFTAAGLINSVNLSWTDATGSPAPDAYLIKASATGYSSITAPTDTSPESNDADLSDGSGALNINFGVETASFSGLVELTTYYFKIFPYSNTGSDIDYKNDGTAAQDDATTLDTPDIVLNEFLADPDGDANGDGHSSTSEDEFMEFVNTGSTDLDITGWTIEEEGGFAHTFPSTVLKPFQPVVVFSGGSAEGYFGGAIVQISSEGGFILNNGGDSIILKNDSGIEIINYSYGGEAGNNQSVTRNPDLTGNFEEHASADPDGSGFSPGLRIDNFSFLPVIQITGTEGWRMLSSPTADNSYDDLLDPIWTQGSETGANYAGGDPNVVIYDGSSFNAVDDLTSNMATGQGFLVFVYEDDDFDPGTSDSFPKILEMSGTENTGPVTPSINEGTNDAATLVGNPFLSPIDWDLLAKNNLTETVYVYDHSYGTPAGDDVSAAGVAGSYRTWSRSGTGSLTGGLIAPFQGFFVLYDGSGTASLTMEESDKTVGGTFYKNEIKQPVFIRLKAETERMFNEAFFSFNKSGRVGIDNFDGLELTPLDHGDYLSLATESEGTLLDINNLPLEISETIEVPLHVNAYQAIEEDWKTTSSKVTLSWPELQNIPSDWTVTLVDTQRKMQINLKETESYTFLVEGSVSKITGKKPFHLSLKNPIQLEKSPQGNRFILSIDPASETSLNDIPDQFSLKQNYPNPFNPVTNIRYEIARSTRVELNVYNVMGQQIATLVNETKAPGAYEVTWDASDMASGIYYYQLNVNEIVFTRQMALIK